MRPPNIVKPRGSLTGIAKVNKLRNRVRGEGTEGNVRRRGKR